MCLRINKEKFREICASLLKGNRIYSQLFLGNLISLRFSSWSLKIRGKLTTRVPFQFLLHSVSLLLFFEHIGSKIIMPKAGSSHSSKLITWIHNYRELKFDGKTVFCTSCEKSIGCERKSQIDAHCNSGNVFFK